MSKLRKVCFIILFALLIIGIATSKNVLAYDLLVEDSTDSDTIISTLKSKNGTGSIWISKDAMYNNSNIFCREYLGSLPSRGACYHLDGLNCVEYYSDSTDINHRIIAYILSRTSENSTYSKRNKQVAFWKALGQYDEDDENLDLYDEAVDYANFITYDQNIKIDKSHATMSTNGTEYGPIIIQYSYKHSKNVDFGGFDYQVLNGSTNINNQAELCTKSSDGTLTEISESVLGDYKIVRSGDYNGVELYLKLHTQASNLKIKVKNNAFACNAKIYEIAGTFDYNTTIYCMSCQSRMHNCITSIYNSRAKTAGTILLYGGNYYEYTGVCISYSTYDSSKAYEQFSIGGTIVETDRFGRTCYECVGVNHKTKCNTKSDLKNHIRSNISNHFTIRSSDLALNSTRGIQEPNEYICKKCSYKASGRDDAVNHYANFHFNYIYEYDRYFYYSFNGCGKATTIGRCGGTTTGEKDAQDLIVVESSTSENITSEEISIDLQRIPGLKLYLEKYNTDGTKTLNRARFTIEARQIDADGNVTELVITEQDANGVCRIVPMEKNYPVPTDTNGNDAVYLDDCIYVMISENTAPDGYSELKKPICIRYNLVYAGGGFSWYPTYAPSWNEWKDLGFSKFGQWTWLEDEDTTGDWYFPNPYQSDEGDKILVNEVVVEGADIKHIIRVYDRAKIDRISLVKVDADSENGNSPLAGAEFTATLKNVKLFKYGNLTISKNNNNSAEPLTYSFIVPYNGLIINDIEFLNEDQPIEIILEETKAPEGTENYYYKKLEGPITIKLWHKVENGIGKISNGTIEYAGTTESIDNNNLRIDASRNIARIIIPNLRLIDLSGQVWLDGNTGVKPVESPDGIMQGDEPKVSNVLVTLNGTSGEISTCTTTAEGKYLFEGLRYNKEYFVTFCYDGVHYIVSNGTGYSDEYATEPSETIDSMKSREDFNDNFKTIKYKQTGTGVNLEYTYNDKVSNLNTLSTENQAQKLYPVKITDKQLEMGSVKDDFKMTANTPQRTYTETTENLNLGLVERATDLALSTNVYNANVTVNGQTSTYNYDNADRFPNILIDATTSNERNVDYNLYLYSSDYYTRLRQFSSNNNFTENDQEENTPQGTTTGGSPKVNVIYTLKVENQLDVDAKVKKIKYIYDNNYDLVRIYYKENGEEENLLATEYENSTTDHSLGINDIDAKGYKVSTYYLEFSVKDEALDLLKDGAIKFNNKAEIMEYYTEQGLIDRDSQPGNYLNNDQIEDDCDEANGITLGIKSEERKISGFVWDDTNKNGIYENNERLIDDVIVQLIELKNVEGRNYEYIWQETKSGADKGLVMNDEGTDTTEYSYSKATGYYEFRRFIPGDYIVRFIYGDEATYDLTSNVITYNGQDYKSSVDSKYNLPWYNTAGYDENANKARDNEARRLETMAWSAEVDANVGILLKLLDVRDVNALNVVEKETLKAYYNEKYDPDVNEIGNAEIEKLLKEATLANTWMCAETSKIKVPVESEDLEEVTTTIEVNGIETVYKYEFKNVGLGLVKRPETKIELSKKLKQMVIRANNGQTILNAYLDENGNLQGQTDGLLRIPGTSWIFSVSPTDINTIIDGASLEFTYDILVTNNGETDTLSETLMNLYNSDINNYKTQLAKYSGEVKTAMRSANNPYTLGTYLGSAYYTGGVNKKVLTEVTNIYDYINNELEPKAMSGLKAAGSKEHYLYNVERNLQKTTINNVLETNETTGKMAPGEIVAKYSVTLAKAPLSSTGTLDFTNYIAEVMSYTNAAGRRAITSTPGNAEAVNKYIAAILEPDESSVEEVQIQPALGEDEKTVYIWLAVITIAVAVTAVGTFVIKKYIVK